MRPYIKIAHVFASPIVILASISVINTSQAGPRNLM